ncbi:MAG: helix-turn-helix domain-containing protein [Bacilli bacterium]|nr:helix-turn-helix domain-containing protein [Bacilli bacterium]
MIYKEKIKQLREQNNLSQKYTAGLLNIERGLYSLYETEYKLFPIKHLVILCDYYNVSFDYIFNFTNTKQYSDNIKNIDLVKSGTRLKSWRRENKLTQDKLAQKLNVARTIISKYEKGEYIIATHTLFDICKKYQVSADYLLGKIDTPISFK